MMIVRKASRDEFNEMMNMMASMSGDPEVDQIIMTMTKWIRENEYGQ